MFTRLRKPSADDYTPLYFLSALGSGGLVVSFFMYLMFWVPHKDSPIPTFSHLQQVFTTGPMWLQVSTALAIVGILIFGITHVRILIWNLKSFAEFKKSNAFGALKNSNAETQLMAQPLTLGMTINVAFIFGALFVPGLWSIVEWMFPFALIAFGAVGYFAFKTYLDFFSRAMAQGGFDCTKNNNLSQILPAFAFSMVGVGFAASAAMSTMPVTVILGMIGAIFFTVTALILATIKLVLGFRAMFEHGAAAEGLPTLLVMIPIMTLVGITIIRIQHGTHVLEGFHTTSPSFLWLTAFVAVQAMFAIMGLALKKRMHYFSTYVYGETKSPSAFALICPGVAGFVLLSFWINKGLLPVMPADLMTKFGITYFVLYIPLIYLQYKTIRMYSLLNRKLLTDDSKSLPLSAKSA